jgi:hypothetical protein
MTKGELDRRKKNMRARKWLIPLPIPQTQTMDSRKRYMLKTTSPIFDCAIFDSANATPDK